MAANATLRAAAIALAVLLPQHAGAENYPVDPMALPLRPVLALCGEADIVSLPVLQQFAARYVPDSRFEIVDGNAPSQSERGGVTVIYVGSLAKSDAPAACAAAVDEELASELRSLSGEMGTLKSRMPGRLSSELGPPMTATQHSPDENRVVRLVVSICDTQQIVVADCGNWLLPVIFSLQMDSLPMP